MQVYSTELVTTLGNACKRLLDELAAVMINSQFPRPPLQRMLVPRVLFTLLQNPLNSDTSGIGMAPHHTAC